MRVFLDANVLVATLNKEYPTFTYSSRVLSLADSSRFDLYTSSLCLAISFHFASKKCGVAMARKKIAILNEKIKLAVISKQAIDKTFQNQEINDLEDGFQYYAAVEAGCECIITEDLNDFYFSKMDVLSSKSFLDLHVF